MYKKKHISELNIGETFVLHEDYASVYQKIKPSGYIRVLHNGVLSIASANMDTYWDVWLVELDSVAVPSNLVEVPDPIPAKKYRIGQFVKVIGRSYCNSFLGQYVKVIGYYKVAKGGGYKGQWIVEVKGASQTDSVIQSVAESDLIPA